MPKVAILGGYEYQGKSGPMFQLTCAEEVLNGVGVCATNIRVQKDKMPCELKTMVGKSYFIDVNKTDKGIFGNGFAELKG